MLVYWRVCVYADIILIHLLGIQRHFHAALGREPRAEPPIGEAQEPGFSKWHLDQRTSSKKGTKPSFLASVGFWSIYQSLLFSKQHFLNIDYPHLSSVRDLHLHRWSSFQQPVLGRPTAGAHPSWGAGSWQIQGDLWRLAVYYTDCHSEFWMMRI